MRTHEELKDKINMFLNLIEMNNIKTCKHMTYVSYLKFQLNTFVYPNLHTPSS